MYIDTLCVCVCVCVYKCIFVYIYADALSPATPAADHERGGRQVQKFMGVHPSNRHSLILKLNPIHLKT